MRTSSLALVLVALSPGCAPPPYEPAEDETAAPSAEDSAAEPVEDTAAGIDIVWPAPEAPVTGCAMLVVELKNVLLTDPIVSLDPVEGQGHYHLLYEGGRYTPCSTPYCLITLDQAGYSYVEAHLVGNDHVPFLDEEGEPIVAGVPLNVTLGECTLGTPSEGY